MQTLFLELNEVNMAAVHKYAERGVLPNFRAFFERHGVAETTSETDYADLEPWIQWVTAHTGLPLSEHGITRLGDIVGKDIEQIWERLADRGVSVGAISPMNAKCRGNNWDFFVPDPWTKTEIVASPVIKRLYEAISQAVNDNAQRRVSISSLASLLVGSAVAAKPQNYALYARLAANSLSKPWTRAIILDQILADLFEGQVTKHRTGFATLFLNAAAHIQHHYMFSSKVYRGSMKNPSWYIDEEFDPVLDVYKAYDRILGSILRRFPNARIMIATGLHQDPHEQITYYWRLKDHEGFLRKIGARFEKVVPLMSRDFVVVCANASEAASTAAKLQSAKADNGLPLFEVDNRGADLFVMLTYPQDVNDMEHYSVNDQVFLDFSNDVSFVAIKNGEHNGIGYFSDSFISAEDLPSQIPLHTLPNRVLEAFLLGDKCVDNRRALATAPINNAKGEVAHTI